MFLSLQFVASLVPSAILKLFAFPAGWVASQFWGAPTERQPTELLLHHPSIAISVTEACSGFTFFSILIAMYTGFVFQNRPRKWLVGFFSIYLVTLAANIARIIIAVELRVLSTSIFPANYQAALHTVIGMIIFLSTAIAFWLAINYTHARTRS